MSRRTVLFLCSANSARSQMAEALLRKKADDLFEVYSAGLRPTEVHPLTHTVLHEIDIDTEGLRAKSTKEYLGKLTVNFAIIVCEQTAQACPHIYPFALRTLLWPFKDPANPTAGSDEALGAFRETRDAIDRRLDEWLAELEQAAPSQIHR